MPGLALIVALGAGLALRPRPAPPVQTSPVAPAAPDFTLPLASAGSYRAHGGTLTLRSLRGHAVLLTFFTTRCGPCLDELAQLVRDGLAQAGAIACGRCAPVEPLGDIATTVGTGHTLDADSVMASPRPAPSFALRDQQGRLITPRRLRGKAVALTFISARCTEQCPLVGRTLGQMAHQLGLDAAHLAIVAISVDPEVDEPAATRAVAAESGWPGTDWHYLSAPRAVLSRVWDAYGIFVPAPPPIFKPGQTIVHQTEVFLIDPQGRLRALYNVPILEQRVAASVRALLAPLQATT